MTYFWSGVLVLLVVGIGLVVWGSRPGAAESGSSGWRPHQAQAGAVLVVASLAALVIAYLTTNAR